ncbi:Presenilin-like protein [Hibiscus syriacus]|uniref:Presenilin n=1 Tax=Hibiscus syriacus TaxID=106335 RepID=A0A6A2YIT8_HIBSY|nr:Presenilin-like protein [Hibiscus syriacus]
MSKMAIVVTQGYLVLIGMLVAYWFTLLPEWTTWGLLVALALYDLAAVLLPVGPLRLLVELAMSREEDIPALVYEARPITHHDPASGQVQRRIWRERLNVGLDLEGNSSSNSNVNVISDSNSTVSIVQASYSGTRIARVEEGQVSERDAELSAPLIDRRMDGQDGMSTESLMLEGMGLGSSGAIKLGLGDFIFYSVLVGRAAMYDFMTAYACYLAIVAGLGITLTLLALYQKALPALPMSIALGVLFYFLTRFLLEVFIVQCSLNLVMF